MKDKIIEALFGEGGLLRVRGLISLSVTATICALWLNGSAVPTPLLEAWAGVVGFYFVMRAVQSGQ